MKGDNVLPVSSPAMHLTSSAIAHSKKESPGSVVFGRSRYKFWALAAMLMLSFWSILTGTVTLRWSAGNLNTVSHDIDIAIHEDLDVIVSTQYPILSFLVDFSFVYVGYIWSSCNIDIGAKLLTPGDGGPREYGEAHMVCLH